MKGFAIDINGQKKYSAVNKGVVMITIETSSISIMGRENTSGISLDWGQTALNIKDKIRIIASEIDKSDIPLNTKKIDRQELLKEYLSLKEMLTKEGVLK